MRFLFTGGGTGGHVYPALAVIGALREMAPDSEFLFVGTKKGLEAEIVPRAGVTFRTVRSLGLRGKSVTQVSRALLEAVRGMGDARSILATFKPHVVMGTGGYVSGPVVLSACLKRIPTLLQEQNVVPGLTNRFLGPWTSGVAIPYEECRRYFSRRVRVLVTGNPVRKEVLRARAEDGVLHLGLEPHLKTLVVLGGSRGARVLLETVLHALPCLPRGKWQALVITGAGYHENARQHLDGMGIKGWWGDHITLIPYLYQMEHALAAADLMVARAGAMTIAEATALGLPTVLIPSPNVVGDHQTINARLVEKAGGAAVIREEDLSRTRLVRVLNPLLSAEDKLKAMGESARRLGKPGAADAIAREVLRLARRGV